MANTLLTISQITKAALPIFVNSNAFLGMINREYSGQYAQDGAKIGDTLNIRVPSNYIVTDGPTLAVQDNTQTTVPLVISKQRHVDIAFTSKEQSLQLEDFEDLILRPALNTLAATVANDVMSVALATPNMRAQGVAFDGTGTLVSPTALTFNQARAQLAFNSAPQTDLTAIMDYSTDVRISDSLKGQFNPTGRISQMFDSGEVRGPALGIANWMSDQTVPVFTAGTFTTMPTVNGANQTGSAITVTAGTANVLLKGDIIAFPSVYAVNRLTGASTGQLRQFVLTADYSGTGTLKIYPALIPAVIVGGLNTVAGATCTASPTTTNTILAALPTGTQYRRNLVFQKDAFTLATADLPTYGKGVIASARENYSGVSIRTLQSYDVANDRAITRMDILYGYASLRPEWACIVPDVL